MYLQRLHQPQPFLGNEELAFAPSPCLLMPCLEILKDDRGLETTY